MPRWLRRTVISAAVILLVAAIVGLVAWNEHTKEVQRRAFGNNLTSIGFVLAKFSDGRQNPGIDTEHKKTNVEAVVVYDGCWVEFEQRFGQTSTRKVRGFKFRLYEFDETVNRQGKEVDDVSGAPVYMTPDDLGKYLRAHPDLRRRCRSAVR